jgi:predicted GNAT superfamily acetyltransferase
MKAGIAPKNILIRDLHSFEDLSRLKAVEKEVWGLADEDVLPLTMVIACQAAGSIFVGAFDQDKLVGFAFGIFGQEQGRTTIHSHLLAVLEPYRRHNLGFRLKQAQRDRALALGVREMTWTYDPLQSRNAHFNFAKLGIVADTYKLDFYGPQTSSMLHQNGTDRLWARWLLASRRVRDRLAGKDARAETLDALRHLAPLVRFNGDGRPARAELAESLARQRVSIEIPGDILEVERTDMGLAREWRAATRWAFTGALKAGFFVAEYCRSIRGQQGPGVYLLQKGAVTEFVTDI